MTDSSYIIRNYRPADFDNYVRLYQRAEEMEPTGRRISPQAIKERLTRPNYSPEQDLFVVIRTVNIIGYMDITPELNIGRVILDCWLLPDHRRKGLATRLLDYATHHARTLGAGVIHVNIMEDNAIAKMVLSRMGFKRVREFLELKRDIARLPSREADQTAQKYRYLRHVEEEKLAWIHNRCFSGTWGYSPNTIDTIAYRTSLSHFSPEDVILACEGEKIIGFCWTEIIPDKETATGEREGRIYMLGVDPDYRRKGLGRNLLLAGLASLSNRGSPVAILTVDRENQAAYALYRSAGFKVQAHNLWYEKAVA